MSSSFNTSSFVNTTTQVSKVFFNKSSSALYERLYKEFKEKSQLREKMYDPNRREKQELQKCSFTPESNLGGGSMTERLRIRNP